MEKYLQWRGEVENLLVTNPINLPTHSDPSTDTLLGKWVVDVTISLYALSTNRYVISILFFLISYLEICRFKDRAFTQQLKPM